LIKIIINKKRNFDQLNQQKPLKNFHAKQNKKNQKKKENGIP